MSSSRAGPSGGVVVDKPRGVTSHDVVAMARRALRTRAVGHAGTLDPMATGVLVLGVGEGTKLCAQLAGDDKSYDAVICFGAATSSDDADGEITERAEVPAQFRAELAALEASFGSAPGPRGPRSLDGAPLLAAALEQELQRIEQVPPRVSGQHLDGERAHVRARRGEALDLPARPVRLRELAVQGVTAERPTLSLSLSVEKGYYVRALARDLGARLGVPAHLGWLRRTRAGVFGLDGAVALSEIAAGLMPLVAFASRALPTLSLGAEETLRIRRGQTVELASPPPRSPVLVLSQDGRAVAIAKATGGLLVVLRGLHDP